MVLFLCIFACRLSDPDIRWGFMGYYTENIVRRPCIMDTSLQIPQLHGQLSFSPLNSFKMIA
jgi:hypothetical protein